MVVLFFTDAVAIFCISSGVQRLQHISSNMVGRDGFLSHQCIHSHQIPEMPNYHFNLPARKGIAGREARVQAEVEISADHLQL